MAWSEIKHALNSTLGTSDFESLDNIIKQYAYLGSVEFKEPIQTGLKVPRDVKYAIITACGAGGGGGAIYNSESGYYGGGGGGGAAISSAIYSVTENTNITITVGRAGGSGSNGGSTVIGNIVTLPGGRTSNPTESSDGGGPAGGSGGGKGGRGGYSATNGSNGIYGKGGTAYKDYGGGGGSLGNGGSKSYGSTGTTVVPTRGGGGATGQSGADGYVYIEWRG